MQQLLNNTNPISGDEAQTQCGRQLSQQNLNKAHTQQALAACCVWALFRFCQKYCDKTQNPNSEKGDMAKSHCYC